MRLLRLALHFVEALFRAAFLYPRASGPDQTQMLRRWSFKLLSILNVRLRVEGTPPPASGAVLVVANHVSWLEIFLLFTVLRMRFVAKAEVRSWPLAGWLCLRTGTLFIERERRQATGRVNQSMTAALKAGDAVGVFPEGTTTNGAWLRHFHASLLQPAVLAGAPVCPVALRYHDGQGRVSTAPAYVDDLSFWDSVKNILAAPEIHAVLHFLPPIPSAGRNRRELARLAEEAIAGALSLEVRHRPPETPGGPKAAPPTIPRPTGSPSPGR